MTHGHRQQCEDWLWEWGKLSGRGQRRKHWDNCHITILKILKMENRLVLVVKEEIEVTIHRQCEAFLW